MKFTRLAACLLLSALPVQALQAQTAGTEPDIRVTLLGTGGPELTPGRQGYATLVEAGGQKLLFDAGRGVLQRIYETRVNPIDVTQVFFTHLHNDHIEGLATLWMTPWFLLGREKPMEAWGPKGTARMIDGMRAMFQFDIEHRVNKFNKLENLAFSTTEVLQGEIYNRDGVRVTAFPVEHDDGNPALGYRVDYNDRSVALSGDTAYSPNVSKYGTGADLIVHNVIAMSERLTTSPEMGPVLRKLAEPEEAARVFTEARPKMAVFSHVVKKELHGRQGDELILQRVRDAGYAGPLEMGYDRMVIEIGDTIKVLQPELITDLPDLDRKGTYASH